MESPPFFEIQASLNVQFRPNFLFLFYHNQNTRQSCFFIFFIVLFYSFLFGLFGK